MKKLMLVVFFYSFQILGFSNGNWWNHTSTTWKKLPLKVRTSILDEQNTFKNYIKEKFSSKSNPVPVVFTDFVCEQVDQDGNATGNYAVASYYNFSKTVSNMVFSGQLNKFFAWQVNVNSKGQVSKSNLIFTKFTNDSGDFPMATPGISGIMQDAVDTKLSLGGKPALECFEWFRDELNFHSTQHVDTN